MHSPTISRPSETTAGQLWLSQFDSAEMSTAMLLIDSLEIHDHAAIMNSLRDELLAARTETSMPASLIAVRSLEDLPRSADRPHVAYDTFDPGSSFPAMPGSEADIGSMSRDLVGAHPNHFLSPQLDISELRSRKARVIYLLADYSGSGTQIKRFVETFLANSTIASWISFGYLELRVLVYAASMEATKLLRAHPHISFTTLTAAKSARAANWSDQQRLDIEELCKKYANDRAGTSVLGYGNSFGLHLSNTRVPNNLPQILVQSGARPGLFADRSLPNAFYAELPAYRPLVSLTQTLRNLGAEDLADRLDASQRPVRGLRALAALQLLDYNFAIEQVLAMLQLDDDVWRQLRTSLISLELLTLDNRLTRAGKQELSRARQRSLRRNDAKASSEVPIDYVPTQLR